MKKLFLFVFILTYCYMIKGQTITKINGVFLEYKITKYKSQDELEVDSFIALIENEDDTAYIKRLFYDFLFQPAQFSNNIMNNKKVYFDNLSVMNYNYNKEKSQLITSFPLSNGYWWNYDFQMMAEVKINSSFPFYQIKIGLFKGELQCIIHVPYTNVAGCYKRKINEVGYLVPDITTKEDFVYILYNNK